MDVWYFYSQEVAVLALAVLAMGQPFWLRASGYTAQSVQFSRFLGAVFFLSTLVWWVVRAQLATPTMVPHFTQLFWGIGLAVLGYYGLQKQRGPVREYAVALIWFGAILAVCSAGIACYFFLVSLPI